MARHGFQWLESPVGWLGVETVDESLIGLSVHQQRDGRSERPSALTVEVVRQLKEYFWGERKRFSIPLDQSLGTPFQIEIWREMERIPFAETVSYGELAERIGRPKAARAVGQACHRNPWPLVLPCHRVVARQGEGGYALGLTSKRFLLAHERRVVLKPTLF